MIAVYIFQWTIYLLIAFIMAIVIGGVLKSWKKGSYIFFGVCLIFAVISITSNVNSEKKVDKYVQDYMKKLEDRNNTTQSLK